jgi:hypothetical protein
MLLWLLPIVSLGSFPEEPVCPTELYPHGFDLQTSSDILHARGGNEVVGELEEDAIFEEIRGTLNPNNHKRYSRVREQWQNAVARLIVGTSKGMTFPPWVILTAGPGGVGKGYVMQYLTELGILALPNLVYVDVDATRAVIPEWPLYRALVKENPGAKTQKEAGLIAELAQGLALRRNRNVVIDGTLSSKDWANRLIARIRHSSPAYKIAVIYVTAPLEMVLQRAADRAAVTGRTVPVDLITSAWTSCAQTVAEVAKIVDLTATIDNDDDNREPVLVNLKDAYGAAVESATFADLQSMLTPQAVQVSKNTAPIHYSSALGKLRKVANVVRAVERMRIRPRIE